MANNNRKDRNKYDDEIILSLFHIFQPNPSIIIIIIIIIFFFKNN